MPKCLRAALLLSLLLAAPAGAGQVSGRLGTPTDVVPSLRVHAWSLTGARLHSLTTEAGQTAYTLELPPGRYWLFTTPADPGAPPVYGAHTEFSACAHARAPKAAECEGHALRAVKVERRRLEGVDLTDWLLDDASTRELDRILGLPAGGIADDEQLSAPKFSEYPAAQFAGARAAALAATPDPRLARDRELLATALASPVNFAGRMVLVRLGCGTGCESVALVDVATGRVAYPAMLATLPASSPCSTRGALLFRRDSRLVTVTGRDRAGVLTRYYVWDLDRDVLRSVASLASTREERCTPPG